ncbi:MAG: hypothetical protein IPI78_05010 [Chitinophagaceae bacterium]|nr:hypothetical protein [Chitinophagaceae bacterium]
MATTAIARFEAQNNALDIGAYSAAPYGNWIQSTAASDLSFNGPIALNPNGGYVGVGVAAPGNHLEVMNDGGSGFNERIALKPLRQIQLILVLQTATGTAAAPEI